MKLTLLSKMHMSELAMISSEPEHIYLFNNNFTYYMYNDNS